MTDRHELIAMSHLLEHVGETYASVPPGPMIITAVDEMDISVGIVAFQAGGHVDRIFGSIGVCGGLSLRGSNIAGRVPTPFNRTERD